MKQIKDLELKAAIALPNAAATVNTAAIDLGQAEPFPVGVCARISTTAATGANNKNINVRLQHSNEASANYVNVSEFANPLLTVTDNNSAGYPAGSVNIALQPAARRYIRAQATGEANGGNAADGSLTVEIIV
jgi:hypothetical protein